jgi:hypothetical protein
VQLVTGHLPHLAPDEPVTWDDPTAVSAWLDAIRKATLRGALRAFEEGPTPLPRGVAALVRRLLAVDPAQRGVTPGKLGALFEEAWERPHGVPDPPYFARRPYPAEAEGLLFGRDDDVARLGRELSYEPCVVLQGASGSGKSSLLNAGLVPFLGRHAVDGKDDWVAVPVAGDHPDAALAEALARLDPALADADAAAVAAFSARSALGLVLVLDPLEDVVRDGAGGARLTALVAAITAGPVTPGLRVLGALGEDGTAELLASPLGTAVRAGLRFVGGPATAAVTDIVAAPAHYAGVTVLGADVVAVDVRRELRASAGRIPYVAIALEEWWRGRGASRTSAPSPSSAVPSSSSAGQVLQGDRWKETGGVGGAVVRHAERVIAALEPDLQMVAEELLLRLSATDGARLRWDAGELCTAVGSAVSADRAAEVLALLVRELLVTEAAGAVEIGHEALLTSFPRLGTARLAQMDRLLLLERLREARVAWERADNHRDFLLHGALAAEVRLHRGWVLRGLGPADEAFLRESRRRSRFQSAKRAAFAALGTLSLVAVVAGNRMIDDAHAEEARTRAAAAELEALAELAAKARRTEDPYHRAALVAAALGRGSTDGLLPLDLLATTKNLARADFLTLDHVDAPSFPWDDRFLVGSLSSHTLTVFDFRPPEPDVIEDVDLDFDPAEPESSHFKRPAATRLRPHEAAVVERLDFAFDTAFATRSADGEVKVFRLRDDGRPALAAVAPVRCIGPVHVAAAAPVLACGTENGAARWDLRQRASPEAGVTTVPFPGDVADLSADGERVAVVNGKEVLFWSPAAGAGHDRVTHVATRPVSLVRLAPHGPVAALLEANQIEILDARRPDQARLTLFPHESAAVSLRWDDGGLDLAVCDGAGAGHWYYLRHGGRPKDDPRPKGDPCAPRRPRGQPEPVPDSAAESSAPELADRDVGPHLPAGGWKLRGHRYLTRDLVVLDASKGRAAGQAPGVLPPAAARLLHFEGRDEIGDEERVEENDSVAAVERDDTAVMFQVGDEMRFYALPEGRRLFTRKGNFLRRCLDGRWLAWEADGPNWRVFDAWVGGSVRTVPREPGFVLGTGAACRVLYTQRLDGTLVEHAFDGRPGRDLGKADGYVFDVRPSTSHGVEHGGSGLLLALSSGAVARIDDATRSVRVLGYATPRARAVADGPHPGEVVFADSTGVVLLRPGGLPVHLCEGEGAGDVTDLSASPDGASLLLASADRIAAVDVARREVTGSYPAPGRDRLARWDDEGSMLLWSFNKKGGPSGVVLPRGVSLARRVAEAVSNLEVERGRVAIRR